MEERCVYCGAKLKENEEKCSCGRTREQAEKDAEERESNAGEKTIEEYMNVERTCEFCANTREKTSSPDIGALICTLENCRTKTDGVCERYISHIMKAKYEVDIIFLTRAINHSPTANDYRNRGLAYMQINDLWKARNDIDMALQLDPYDIEAQKIRDELKDRRR